MRQRKKIVLWAVMSAAALGATAQETLEATIGADIVSQYIWRGQDLGHVSVQPSLGVSYRGISLSAWGNTGLESTDTKEFDLTASYTVSGLSMGINDYWTDDPEGRYFLYNAHRTSHVFEAFASYDFGILSAAWYTIFAGNDGFNPNGKRAYSSYFEANVPFCLTGIDWTATAGVVPFATDYYNARGFAVTNLSLKATKEIKVTESFSIPVFGQIIGNPCSQKAYFVFGFTLQP